MSSELVRVTYVKSAIGYNQRQKETVRSLGLRRIGDVVIHESNPAILGMVRSIAHLVSVETMSEADVVGENAEPAGRKSRGAKA